MMKDETNHHHSAASTSSSSGESEDESGSDSGTSTVTCASIHSRGGISSGSGLTSSSGSSGWSSAGQAVYSPMKLTKRWRKTHEAESENNELRYMNQEGGSKMAVEAVSASDQEEEEEEERSSYNALDLSCYGHGMDYSCGDSRSLEVVANWLDRNHHHALRAAGAAGPLSPPTTPPTMFADMNESGSNTSIHRLSRGEQHLNGMGFLAPSPSASDSSNFSSSSSKLHHQQQVMMAGMVSSTQVMTPKSSPCCSPNTNGIKNSQGQNGYRSFGPLSAPSTSCSSSPPSSNYRHLNTSNNCNPSSMSIQMSSRPLFPPSSTCSSASLAATATTNGYHPQLSGSSLDQNGSDQFSCLYLLASAAVSELERQRLHQSPSSSPSNPATSNAAQSAVVHTLAVIS